MDNRYRKILLLCALLLSCCLTAFLAGDGGRQLPAGQPAAAVEAEPAGEAGRRGETVRVYVSGAVLSPGLYDLPQGARADAAVAAAGGFAANADVNRVNLAKSLKDGAHVSVPAVKAAKKAGGTRGAAGKKPADAAFPVNINTAAAEELDALPGVGPALAARIIACREARPFASPDDLLKVPGIGKARLEQLRPLVTVR